VAEEGDTSCGAVEGENVVRNFAWQGLKITHSLYLGLLQMEGTEKDESREWLLS
jgi:hypothetical protein